MRGREFPSQHEREPGHHGEEDGVNGLVESYKEVLNAYLKACGWATLSPDGRAIEFRKAKSYLEYAFERALNALQQGLSPVLAVDQGFWRWKAKRRLSERSSDRSVTVADIIDYLALGLPKQNRASDVTRQRLHLARILRNEYGHSAIESWHDHLRSKAPSDSFYGERWPRALNFEPEEDLSLLDEQEKLCNGRFLVQKSHLVLMAIIAVLNRYGEVKLPELPELAEAHRLVLPDRSRILPILIQQIERIKRDREVDFDHFFLEPRIQVGETTEIIQPGFSIARLFGSDHSRVLIIGDSGMGKSSLLPLLSLEALATHEATEDDDQTYAVPFVVDLRNYWTAGDEKLGSRLDAMRRLGVIDLLRSCIQRINPEYAEDELVPLVLSAWPWIVVLDGVDEMLRLSERQRSVLLDLAHLRAFQQSSAPDLKIVAALRGHEYLRHSESLDAVLEPENVISVLPVDPKAAEKYLPSGVYQDKRLSEDVKRECTNVSFIRMLREELEEGNLSIDTRLTITDVFKRFVEARLRQADVHMSARGVWVRIFSKLAFEMESDLTLRVPAARVEAIIDAEGLQTKYYGQTDWLDRDEFRQGILRRAGTAVGRSEPPQVEFWHQRLQSYLAGTEAARIWQEDQGAAEVLLRKHALAEAFPHVAALLPDPDPFLAWLQWLDDPLIAGRSLRYAEGSGGNRVPQTTRASTVRWLLDQAFREEADEERLDVILEGLKEATGTSILRDIRELGLLSPDREQTYPVIRLTEWADERDAASLLSGAIAGMSPTLERAPAKALEVVRTRELTSCLPAILKHLESAVALAHERTETWAVWPDSERQEFAAMLAELSHDEDEQAVLLDSRLPAGFPRPDVLRAFATTLAAFPAEVRIDLMSDMLETWPMRVECLHFPFRPFFEALLDSPGGRHLLANTITSGTGLARENLLAQFDHWIGETTSVAALQPEVLPAIESVIPELRHERQRLIQAIDAIDAALVADSRGKIPLANLSDYVGSERADLVKSVTVGLLKDKVAIQRFGAVMSRIMPESGEAIALDSVPIYLLTAWLKDRLDRSLVPQSVSVIKFVSQIVPDRLEELVGADRKVPDSISELLQLKPVRIAAYSAAYSVGLLAPPPTDEMKSAISEAIGWSILIGRWLPTDKDGFLNPGLANTHVWALYHERPDLPPPPSDPACIQVFVDLLIRRGQPEILSQLQALYYLPPHLQELAGLSYRVNPESLCLAMASCGDSSALSRLIPTVVESYGVLPGDTFENVVKGWEEILELVARGQNPHLAALVARTWAETSPNMRSLLGLMSPKLVRDVADTGFFGGLHKGQLLGLLEWDGGKRSRSSHRALIPWRRTPAWVAMVTEVVCELGKRGALPKLSFAVVSRLREQLTADIILETERKLPGSGEPLMLKLLSRAIDEATESTARDRRADEGDRGAGRMAEAALDAALGLSVERREDLLTLLRAIFDCGPLTSAISKALVVLARFDPEGALDRIERHLELARSATDAEMIVRALELAGGPGAIETLKNGPFIDHPDVRVRSRARSAIRRLSLREELETVR